MDYLLPLARFVSLGIVCHIEKACLAYQYGPDVKGPTQPVWCTSFKSFPLLLPTPE